jgi:hypothetical protein
LDGIFEAEHRSKKENRLYRRNKGLGKPRFRLFSPSAECEKADHFRMIASSSSSEGCAAKAHFDTSTGVEIAEPQLALIYEISLNAIGYRVATILLASLSV